MEIVKPYEFKEIENELLCHDGIYSLRSNENYKVYNDKNNNIYLKGIKSGLSFKLLKGDVSRLAMIEMHEPIKKEVKTTKKEPKKEIISDDIVASIIKFKSEGLTPSKIGRKLKLKTAEVRKVLDRI